MSATYPDAPGHRGVDTSIEAAAALEPRLGRLQKLALNAVQCAADHGCTADETAARPGLDRWSVQPRLSELRRKGLIRDYDKPFLDEIYLCVLVAASLTKEAFLWDPAGDEFVIDSGRQIIRRQAEGLSSRSAAGQGKDPRTPGDADRLGEPRVPRQLKHLRNYRRALHQRN